MNPRLASLVATLLAVVVVGATLSAAVAADGDWAPPPANARFDYQIGGDYTPPKGVKVVSRDWFEGEAPSSLYVICYVNAYQTQPDDDGSRPDEKSQWPEHLVLTELGDDPNWGGEYLIDISTPEFRTDAANHVQQMIQECDTKGFEAVEFDNLDSWTRFDDTPLEDEVPFDRDDAIAYAELLVAAAHDLGLAAAQKNTADLTKAEARTQIGFDFAIAEECGRWKECGAYRKVYGNNVIVIEYRLKDFKRDCKKKKLRRALSVVLRDVNVSTPGAKKYVYKAC